MKSFVFFFSAMNINLQKHKRESSCSTCARMPWFIINFRENKMKWRRWNIYSLIWEVNLGRGGGVGDKITIQNNRKGERQEEEDSTDT